MLPVSSEMASPAQALNDGLLALYPSFFQIFKIFTFNSISILSISYFIF